MRFYLPTLAHRLEAGLAPLQKLADSLQTRLPHSGLLGQAAAGALLALLWAPCAGPTLAAAFVLAARGGSLFFAILSMSIFALGAAGALLGLGYGLGRMTGGARRAALATGAGGRLALGGAFALVGLLILTGGDHWLESLALAHMPDWLNSRQRESVISVEPPDLEIERGGEADPQKQRQQANPGEPVEPPEQDERRRNQSELRDDVDQAEQGLWAPKNAQAHTTLSASWARNRPIASFRPFWSGRMRMRQKASAISA